MAGPWEKYQKVEKSGPWEKFAKNPSQLETALRSGAQGLSYGFADELAGALGAGKDIISGNAKPSELLSRYEQNRNAYREADRHAEEANPKTALAAELLGGLITPGGSTRSLAKMAALGAINAIGKSQELPDAGRAGLIGGLAGLGGGVAGKVLSHAIPNAAQTAELAVDRAVKHLRPTPLVAKALGPKGLGEVGREALDTGAIRFGGKAGQTAERLNVLRNEAGQKIGDIVEKSDAKVAPHEFRAKIQKDVIAPLDRYSENEPFVRDIRDRADRLIEKHAGGKSYGPAGEREFPASLLEGEKSIAQGKTNYTADSTAKRSAEKMYNRALKEVSEEAVKKTGQENSKAFELAKKQYGLRKAAQKMAERTGALTNGGTGLMGGLIDLGAGVEALNEARKGNLGTAGLIAVARGATKGRMHSMQAVMADRIAKKLSQMPKTNAGLLMSEDLLKRGLPVLSRQQVK